MQEIERDVAATPEEFRRGLEFAFPGRVSEMPDGFAVSGAAAAMRIHLAPLPPRVIALLRLPRLHVRIVFGGEDAAEQAALLERMDRAMQRGGG